MAAKGSALKGALAAGPRGRVTSLPVKPRPIPLGKPNAAGMVAGIAQGAGAGLERVSPGMYRNPQGQLVNSAGGNLPGQQKPQRLMPPKQPNMGSVLAGAAQGANQCQPQQPMQPATRPPMPYGQGEEQQILSYTGGSPNFYNSDQYNNQFQSGFGAGFNGQYNPSLSAITQASQATQQQMGQFQPPMGQYGYGRQMGQQYNPMQAPQRIPAQQDMQPQQGIVAPPLGTPNNGNIY